MSFQRICAHCNKPFVAERSAAKYCCRDCGWLAKKVSQEIKCQVCQKAFYPRPADRKYCSRECYYIGKRGKPVIQPKEHPTIICETCGKSFGVYPSEIKRNPRFCCDACFYKWLNGSERAPRIDVNCLTCGKPMRVLKSRYENEERGRYCSRKCMMQVRPAAPKKERVKCTCLNCGKVFYKLQCQLIREGDGRFCSKKCAHKGRIMPQRKEHIERTCKHCGKVFYVRPSVMTRPNRGKYCSAQCRGAATAAVASIISPTSIEKLLIDELNTRNVKFEFQYPFSQLVLDFAFPAYQLAVEADGKYWHNLPGAKVKDRRKDKYLERRGWTIIRFGEDEINQSPSACIDKIIQFLDSHTQLHLF